MALRFQVSPVMTTSIPLHIDFERFPVLTVWLTRMISSQLSRVSVTALNRIPQLWIIVKKAVPFLPKSIFPEWQHPGRQCQFFCQSEGLCPEYPAGRRLNEANENHPDRGGFHFDAQPFCAKSASSSAVPSTGWAQTPPRHR